MKRKVVNPAKQVGLNKWIPASAVRLVKRGGKIVTQIKNTGRRNVADGFVDSAGRFHPIRWARDYDPSRTAEDDDEYNIHPSAKYYRKHGQKPPKRRKKRR